MSIKVTSHVYELEGVPPAAKFVLVAYSDHADNEGRNIFPAIGTVARKTGYSDRTVQRQTKELVKMGLLIPDGKVRLYGSRGSGMNRWRYNWNWIPPEKGDIHDAERVTSTTGKGDSVSPEPSLTILSEPSLTPASPGDDQPTPEPEPPPPPNLVQEEELFELTTSDCRQSGMGAAKRWMGACPAAECGNDLIFRDVGDVVECMEGHETVLLKRKRKKVKRMYKPEIKVGEPLWRAYLMAMEWSKKETGRVIWFKGFFKEEQYEQWKGLILDSVPDVLPNWGSWLARRFEEGKRGRNLVVAALAGLNWASGGPPPTDRQGKKDEIERFESTGADF